MLSIVHSPVASPDPALAEIALCVDRLTLAKRLWRGVADDGMEFGFELAAPLKHGETFWQTATARYVVQQPLEAVLAISLDAIAPSAAAGIGWAIGNLHREFSSEPTRLLAPDEPALRQLFDRLKIPFQPTTIIFRPGRFARGDQSAHELGASHRH
jgi:urease accessory protein